ncbi:heparan-alpha-glucosaminide N-acetyltransferase domain-containing protein [Pseudoalteromonas sp. SMS1]|uniref:DUF1624 domain-containing protein n=1 Tax=Pseudoalteromonas sp. SMS1 TaxID=2908894 RepID=UPI001F478070|nr:heparan-alpha-glucosaminide N-acetyltransferase domain-containing protein [Pseudoalteromonas sp. SMS1]MCF2859808.1 heparan-alpha-glucosaminide N-acetyltransferase domain-containing protein [Pseudoalteromonas sp. SMS1]
MGNKNRLISLDILRGFIIILMALDHTRHYWAITPFMPTDIENSTPAWFFTRWVTHFCAPLFVFLTGISAYLYGEKVQSRTQLRNYLLSRGMWLVFLELTVISFSWQFAFDIVILQVIWVIGWSMVILAGLIYLPMKWLGALSVSVITFHNSFNDTEIISVFGTHFDWLWHLLHAPTIINLTANWQIFVIYPLIPWFAVMALGYFIAPIFNTSRAMRCRIFASIGLISIATFVLLKLTNFYGDPNLFIEYPSTVTTLMSLLNTTKYPPSLLYLLMTLGPGLLMLAVLEQLTLTTRWIAWLKVFGGVPLFYYLIHIPFINLSAQLYAKIQYGRTIGVLDNPDTWPPLYHPNLWLVYLMWVLLTAALYLPCKHYLKLKRTSQNFVFKYL